MFIIFNKNVPASREVAEHYAPKRSVPADNLIALDLPDGEDISRADYDKRLVAPLRDALKDRKDKAKVLLTVYGVPLRVGRPEPSADEKAESGEAQSADRSLYQKKVRAIDEDIKALEAEAEGDANLVPALAERRAERDVVQGLLQAAGGAPPPHRITPRARPRWTANCRCCGGTNYELRRWQLNLLYFQVPEKCAGRQGPW